MEELSQTIMRLLSNGRLSSLAHNITLIGKQTPKNMMVLESVEGYALLIENVINLPSEVASPRAISEIPSKVKTEWQWGLFEDIPDRKYVNRSSRVDNFLKKVEDKWNSKENSVDNSVDDTFLYSIWEEEKSIQTTMARKRREDGEVSNKSFNFLIFCNLPF